MINSIIDFVAVAGYDKAFFFFFKTLRIETKLLKSSKEIAHMHA